MDEYKEIRLIIPGGVAALMEQRHIFTDNVQETIHFAETSGEKFIDISTGRSLASFRPGKVTYWVEYSLAGEEYEVHAAYSHKMELRRKSGADEGEFPTGGGWSCNQCNVSVKPMLVLVQYLNTDLAVDLPACPRCRMVMIEEGLATGKMAEVEKAIEDK